MSIFADETPVTLLSPNSVYNEFRQNKNCKAESYTAKNGAVLPYRLYVPEKYDPQKSYPLVLFFHGAGERGTDNRAQVGTGGSILQRLLTEEEKKNHPCFILAPQCPTDSQWVLSDWGIGTYDHTKIKVSPYMLAAEELLDNVIKEYSVDESSLYVSGISMGGYGTWDIISRNPDKFAAAIPVCGGIDTSYMPVLQGFPIWAFHNSGDTIVPSIGSRTAYDLLKDYGKMAYTEYDSTAHNAWSAAYAEAELTDWLFSQRAYTQVQYSGSVAISFDGPSSVPKGEDLSFTYTATHGYILKELYCGEENIAFDDAFSGSVTIQNYSGQELHAACGRIFYIELHLSDCTADLPSYIEDGQMISFTVTANDGYEKTSVFINGQELLSDENGTYTLANIGEDLVLEISAKPKSEHSNTWVPFVIVAVAAAVAVAAIAVIVCVTSKKRKSPKTAAKRGEGR